MTSHKDFELRVTQSNEQYRIDLVSSPAGEASEDVAFPFQSLHELDVYLLKMGHRPVEVRGVAEHQKAALELGKRLFRWLVTGAVERAYRTSIALAESEGYGLRLRLRIGDEAELRSIPWEFLYDDEKDQFVGASTRTPIVRHLEVSQPTDTLAVEGPLSILVVVSSPTGSAALDTQTEWESINDKLHALIDSDLIKVARLDPPTLDSLRSYLLRNEVHVLHFIGHGEVSDGEGNLLFEHTNGEPHLVSATRFSGQITDATSLRLVVLNACDGARTTSDDPVSGLAQKLIIKGIPAVLAMQFQITDRAALVLARTLYEGLSVGVGVDVALAEARKALHGVGLDSELGTPLLLMRSDSGRLFDVPTSAHGGGADTAEQRIEAGIEVGQSISGLPPGGVGTNDSDLQSSPPEQGLKDADGHADRSGFLREDALKEVIRRWGNLSSEEQIGEPLLLFKTSEQRTWLVPSTRSLYCLKDDEDTRRDANVLQWRQSKSQIQSITAYADDRGTRRIDIGRRQRWRYSRSLFAEHSEIEESVRRLISESPGTS